MAASSLYSQVADDLVLGQLSSSADVPLLFTDDSSATPRPYSFVQDGTTFTVVARLAPLTFAALSQVRRAVLSPRLVTDQGTLVAEIDEYD